MGRLSRTLCASLLAQLGSALFPERELAVLHHERDKFFALSFARLWIELDRTSDTGVVHLKKRLAHAFPSVISRDDSLGEDMHAVIGLRRKKIWVLLEFLLKR